MSLAVDQPGRLDRARHRVAGGLMAAARRTEELGVRCPLLALSLGLPPTQAEYYVARSILAREWGPAVFAEEGNPDTISTVLAATGFRVALLGLDAYGADLERYLK